jgi:hypothetical protein
VRVGICIGDGGWASRDGVQAGFASCGGKLKVVKFGGSCQGVPVGCCELLVSIFRWSKPPYHVKVNPLREVYR